MQSPQPTRMQRTSGTGRLAVRHMDGRTRLGRLYQEGAAKIRLPKTYSGEALDAVLINTAGGLTGGDRFHWSIDIGHGAGTVITTQACEKIYKAADDHADIDVSVTIDSCGALAWLPQETILFDRAALRRRLTVDLAPDAGLLLVEPIIFGRQAMGETVHNAQFHDRWRIRRDGRLLHAEDFRLSDEIDETLQKTSVAGGAIAMATLLLVHADAADLVEHMRADIGDQGGVSAISSSAGDRLVARVTAESGMTLRRALIPAITRCNRFLIGAGHGLPKLWTI